MIAGFCNYCNNDLQINPVTALRIESGSFI